jgi:hypothetical protein
MTMKKTVTPDDLGCFQCLLQHRVQTYWAKSFNLGFPPVIEIMAGVKYSRIVLMQGPGVRSAYGFIDLTNGDLLKSDGWKKPAKHARGNIFADNPLAGCGPYGMAYLK